MKPVGDPKHLVIGTKIDLGKRTGDQRRADVRLLAQKPMANLRARQKAVGEAQRKNQTAYGDAHAVHDRPKMLELLKEKSNLDEQERDLGNAIGLKVITTPGFDPRRK